MASPPDTGPDRSPSTPWWTELDLAVDQRAAWQLGPLSFWIRRRRNEWRIVTRREPEAPEQRCARQHPAEPPPDEGIEVLRFGFETCRGRVKVAPVLAPLPVVCRPDVPFILHPGAAVWAMVSTPLWVRVSTPEVPILHELDILRPSRTWFGPDTQNGELAYASRTRLRLHRDELDLSPTRAVTRVHVKNEGIAPLHIALLNVPVQRLSLVAADDGSLWTESLHMGSTAEGLVAVDVGELPPEARGPLIQGPRLPPNGRGFTQALARVFG